MGHIAMREQYYAQPPFFHIQMVQAQQSQDFTQPTFFIQNNTHLQAHLTQEHSLSAV